MVGFMKVALAGVTGEAYNIGNPSLKSPVLISSNRLNPFSAATWRTMSSNIRTVIRPTNPSPRAGYTAQLQLKYMPKVSLDDGLKRFLDWSGGPTREGNDPDAHCGAGIRSLGPHGGRRDRGDAGRSSPPSSAPIEKQTKRRATPHRFRTWREALDRATAGIVLAVPPSLQPEIAVELIENRSR